MEENEQIYLFFFSQTHQKKKKVGLQKPIVIKTLKEKIAFAFQLLPEERVVKVIDSDNAEIETDFDCEVLQSNQELKVVIEVRRIRKFL